MAKSTYVQRRFIQTLAPVEAMNGKLDNTSKIVKNIEGGAATGVQFYYGFKRGNMAKAGFGLREKSRNLTTNPYSTEETAQKNLFKTCSTELNTQVWVDPSMKSKVIAEWVEQGIEQGFKTARSWAMSRLMHNNGTIPNEWQEK